MPNKLSDEYILKNYIGNSIEHNAQIYLEEYQTSWPVLFEREKQRIHSLLSENALMIEHIGSTSVPGLCAKPIIDILLVVKDTRDEESYVPALSQGGYVLRIKEPEFEHHHMFKGPDTDINLHVFPLGSKEIEKYLRLRNYLRKHEEARIQYGNAKKELAKRTWKYVQNYADAKTEVITSILDKAFNE